MEEEILKTLIDTYQKNGVNLGSIVNDPLFLDLTIPQRISAIRKYGDMIRNNSKANVSDMLRGYALKTMSAASKAAPLAALTYAGFRPGGLMYSKDNTMKGAYLTALAALLPKTVFDLATPSPMSDRGGKYLQRYKLDAGLRDSFRKHENFSNVSNRDVLEIFSRNNLNTRR